MKLTGVGSRAASRVSVEQYTAERKAELLLSNAVDEPDYRTLCIQVRKMGLDPELLPHIRPIDSAKS